MSRQNISVIDIVKENKEKKLDFGSRLLKEKMHLTPVLKLLLTKLD